MKIKLVRPCVQEPVVIKESVDMDVASVVTEKGERFPAQKTDEGILAIVSGPAGEMELTPSCEKIPGGLSLKKTENAVEVYEDGAFFTAFCYDPAIAKPYLGPICAPDGVSFTRLQLDAEEHPHQRSFICAVGDVNGVDFWNEYGNFGYERVRKVDVCEGETACAIKSESLWQDKDGNSLVREKRKYTFYRQDGDGRYIDFETTFFADFGEVKFGDTKEAGPLGVRVADFMRPDRGARMENAYGGVGEAECWSKSAPYCLYESVKDGKKYGIAVMDNEKNERYPTAWHARDYGLFAANNLYFKGGLVIKAGESLTYRFRLFFYTGDKNVQDRFNLYVRSQNA